MQIDAEFPPKLQILFRHARYKILYGGRGGAKSWGVARALLLLGMQRSIRVLCARELQKSISDSVHKLLKDQIELMGLENFYTVQKNSITGANGTEFLFEGLRHNITSIKSYEGVDYCWVEEGQSVTEASWQILAPTIRKPNSEIWVTLNPDLETDATYQRFIKNRQPNSIVVKINWRDNPWFNPDPEQPSALEQERIALKVRDPDAYLHVWEGNCKLNLEGAVYAQELREALAEGRITSVAHYRSQGVSVIFDLGWADSTAMWFVQNVGMETRFIDYYTNRQHKLDHYLGVIQARGYIVDTLWLPHDAKAKQLGTGKSIEELCRAKGFRTRIVPRLSLTDGINAARTIFPNCFFDEEKCKEGLEALKSYRYEAIPGTGSFSKNPLHDKASHGSDAFRYAAIALGEPKTPSKLNLTAKVKRAFVRAPGSEHLGWMGRG